MVGPCLWKASFSDLLTPCTTPSISLSTILQTPFTISLNTSGVSACTWWPAPLTKCTSTNELGLAKKNFSPEELSIQERVPYINVTGTSVLSWSILSSMGLLENPKESCMLEKAFSPLQGTQETDFIKHNTHTHTQILTLGAEHCSDRHNP